MRSSGGFQKYSSSSVVSLKAGVREGREGVGSSSEELSSRIGRRERVARMGELFRVRNRAGNLRVTLLRYGVLAPLRGEESRASI